MAQKESEPPSHIEEGEPRLTSQIIDSIKSFDDTAKQLITMGPILVGLYFNAFTFAKVSVGVSIQLIVYLLPIALIIVSLLSALYVFFPAGYVELAQEQAHSQSINYAGVIQHKLFWFRLASITFVMGVTGVFLALMTYLLR